MKHKTVNGNIKVSKCFLFFLLTNRYTVNDPKIGKIVIPFIRSNITITNKIDSIPQYIFFLDIIARINIENNVINELT